MRPTIPASFFVLLLASTSAGQQDGRPWNPDDVVEQERASDWTLSRDGKLALWVRHRPDSEKDEHVATLMLSDVATGEHRELTVGRHDVSQPALSPAARFVSFLSKRPFPDGVKDLDEKERGAQIWTLDLRGGEARPLTRVPHGVRRYQWIDEKTIFLAARDRRSRRELDAADRKDDSRVVECPVLFGDGAVRLFRFDVAEKELVRLTGGREPVQTFVASPDGRFVAALHGRSPSYRAENDVPPRCLLHDLESGEAHELFSERKSKPRDFVWDATGRVLWARVPEGSVDGEDWAAIETVYRIDAETREAVRIADRDVSLRGAPVACEGGFAAVVSGGVRPRLRRWRWSAQGGAAPRQSEIEIQGTVFELVKARDCDRVLWITGDASTPDRVMTGRLSSDDGGDRLLDAAELYRPNDGFEDLAIARVEVVRWTGAEDDEIEGLLYYPKDWQEGEKCPLVLITHGGPHGVDLDRFSERWASTPNLYTGRGAFVLKVNYHGSSDYGLAFGESIKGRYYELEVVDLLTGIEHLDGRGLVDTARMGLVGWSNGAILSVAVLAFGHRYAPGLDYRFKACAPGAGDVNWTSDYGNCAFGASFDEYYLGATPWGSPETYLAKSPLMEVERITTPTIIFFGTKDTAVPTEQGWQWYRALNRVGKAPVRFVLFPGEGHGLKKLSHQRRKLTEELAWMDRHLFGEESEPPLVKNGSPLDVALRQGDLARAGGVLGVRHGEVIVPETAALDGFEAGRLEVTWAQWAFFDDAEPASGREDAPRVGVTAEQAEAYVAWLRETTGEPWRLLTAEEHAELPRGSEENTLDFWAGYAPAPQDARRLRARLVELGLERVLSSVATGMPGTYRHGKVQKLFWHAGGNADEWVLDGATVRPAGASVLASPDDPAEQPDVPPAVIGLRVAKELPE